MASVRRGTALIGTRAHYAGTARVYTFTVTDSAGTAVDITGASAITFVVTDGRGGEALLSKSLLDGIAITNGPAGIYTVTLATTDAFEAADGDVRYGPLWYETYIDTDGSSKMEVGYNQFDHVTTGG